MSALTDGLRRLLAPLPAFDGAPTQTPPGRYACVYTDSGVPSEHRLAAASARVRITASIVAVGRTRDAARASAREARARLAHARPTDTASVLIEQQAGPLIESATPGDTRYSITLTYACTIDNRDL